MSKKIFLIESDTSFSRKLRDELEGMGFTVDESADGKTAVESVRRGSPDLIVLAVELSAGQSGYIVCGKLKKDDDLKAIPVIITGKDAEGFESHKRLRTRAEDYLRKPFEPSAILEKVGALIGFPEQDEQLSDLVMEEDGALGLGILDEESGDDAPGETRDDPDLDLLDAAFEPSMEEDSVGFGEDADEELTSLDSLEELEEDSALDDGLFTEAEESGDADSALDALGEDGEDEAFDNLQVEEEKPFEEDVVLEGLEELPPPLPAAQRTQQRPPPPSAPAMDSAELDGLRDQVAELESRNRELTDELTAKDNELEAVRSTTGGKDQEFFALREQQTKKDKEILRLKQELHEKESEVIDLREKENGLERELSGLRSDTAVRDAQVKTLTQRAESMAAEKRKSDSAANALRDEARQMSATLATAQGELDQLQDSLAEKNREAHAARSEADRLNGEMEALRHQANGAAAELARSRDEAQQAKSELTARASQWEEESRTLRARIAELEEAGSKNEDRVVKAYQKIKTEEKVKEKTRKALVVALQLLEDGASTASGRGESPGEEEALS